jgi:hypothetical protein
MTGRSSTVPRPRRHYNRLGDLPRTYRERYNAAHSSQNCAIGTSSMLEMVANPLLPSSSLLLSRKGIQESQLPGPDPSLPRARDARGRFARASSGNPQGRPRGIRNPKRRVPDLVTRPLSAQVLSSLLDRKPHLLRPFVLQLLPPPIAPIDPAECLGIDLASLRTVEDFQQLLPTVLAAIARGDRARRGARASRGGCVPG